MVCCSLNDTTHDNDEPSSGYFAAAFFSQAYIASKLVQLIISYICFSLISFHASLYACNSGLPHTHLGKKKYLQCNTTLSATTFGMIKWHSVHIFGISRNPLIVNWIVVIISTEWSKYTWSFTRIFSPLLLLLLTLSWEHGNLLLSSRHRSML